MLYRNGNFCSFCRRKCTIPVVGDLKKITGYSYMGETLNLLCSESFAAGKNVDGVLFAHACNIYKCNRLVCACILNICDQIVMSMFHLE